MCSKLGSIKYRGSIMSEHFKPEPVSEPKYQVTRKPDGWHVNVEIDRGPATIATTTRHVDFYSIELDANFFPVKVSSKKLNTYPAAKESNGSSVGSSCHEISYNPDNIAALTVTKEHSSPSYQNGLLKISGEGRYPICVLKEVIAICETVFKSNPDLPDSKQALEAFGLFSEVIGHWQSKPENAVSTPSSLRPITRPEYLDAAANQV